MKSNEAAGFLSQALNQNHYPTSYLSELTRFLDIELGSSEPLSSQQQSLLQHLLFSLQQQTPIEYLVGKALFYNRRFTVTRDVLIPRFDTENLVERALNHATTIEGPLSIIDIGTGSGAIIITLALELAARKHTKFIATDISDAALEIAHGNARTFAVDKQILFQVADVFPRDNNGNALLPVAQHVIIVSNPPYIADQHFATLPPSVKNFEPGIALREQPGLLAALGTYCELLGTAGKTVSLHLEYNDKNGIAQFTSFMNPTGEVLAII